MAGHPARKDPQVERLYKAMKSTVESVQSLDGRLTDDTFLKLRASALGLMFVYSELTGLPAPDQVIKG